MSHEILGRIVKKYDVRGLVANELTTEVVAALAAGFATELELAGKEFFIGHDMRPSSPVLARTFAEAASAAGANPILLGLCSTDESYFASGHFQLAAVMFTASHNPASYNGMKFSRPGARGISMDTGLAAIRDRAAAILQGQAAPRAQAPGVITERDVLGDYARLMRELVDLSAIRPLRIVVDAANGMAGMTVPAVLGTAVGLPELPIEVIPMYFELDGTFPNHEANPLDPKNLVDLQRAVLAESADLGLAFDGDADRCFVIDERGNPVSPSAVTAIVAERELRKSPGSTIIHNLLVSRAVPERIAAAGGKPHRTKVGHSLIKDEMAATGASFGGEHSAHYYSRDFWGADNGMLAALHLIAEFAAQPEPLSKFAKVFDPYFASGEINSTVSDPAATVESIVSRFGGGASLDRLDGITVAAPAGQTPWWWFNVRSSNTEPLLRLNVESESLEKMQAIRDEVLSLIRQRA